MGSIAGIARRDALTILELPEEILLARLRNGDPQSLEKIYDRYSTAVYSLALRIVGEAAAAEEIVQDVFWRVWNQSGQFEPKKGRFSTWVLSIAHHLAIDHQRRISRRPRNAEDSAIEHAFATVPDPGPPPDEAAWMVERRGVIRAGLATLPVVQREAIELAYFGGFTQVEIASAQSAPVSTVKTRLALGLKKLADYLSLRGIDLEDALR